MCPPKPKITQVVEATPPPPASPMALASPEGPFKGPVGGLSSLRVGSRANLKLRTAGAPATPPVGTVQ